jgi:hypothetical protein
MKRQMDLDVDLGYVQSWLASDSYSASADMKERLRALWWAYQESRERAASLTNILVAAAVKSLDLRKSDNQPPT